MREKDSIEMIEHEVALLLRRVEATRKESAQLDRASHLLLDALDSRGPLTISALAQLFQLDISTLSRQTSTLEANGWIARTDTEDGRVRALELTDSGLSQLEASRTIRYALYTELLGDWTEEDRKALGSLLARFNQAISNRRSLLPTKAPEADVVLSEAE